MLAAVFRFFAAWLCGFLRLGGRVRCLLMDEPRGAYSSINDEFIFTPGHVGWLDYREINGGNQWLALMRMVATSKNVLCLETERSDDMSLDDIAFLGLYYHLSDQTELGPGQSCFQSSLTFGTHYFFYLDNWLQKFVSKLFSLTMSQFGPDPYPHVSVIDKNCSGFPLPLHLVASIYPLRQSSSAQLFYTNGSLRWQHWTEWSRHGRKIGQLIAAIAALRVNVDWNGVVHFSRGPDLKLTVPSHTDFLRSTRDYDVLSCPRSSFCKSMLSLLIDFTVQIPCQLFRTIALIVMGQLCLLENNGYK